MSYFVEPLKADHVFFFHCRKRCEHLGLYGSSTWPWFLSRCCVAWWGHWPRWVWINGSIPIFIPFFSGMNIHKSQLFWCELQGYLGFWHTARWNPLILGSLWRGRGHGQLWSESERQADGWVWSDRLWTIWCEKEQISSIETRPAAEFSNVFFSKTYCVAWAESVHVSSYRLEDSETTSSCWNQPKTEVLTILPEAVQLLGFLQVCLPGQWHVLSLELSSLWPLHVQRASIGLWKRWLGTWRRRWCQWLWTASMTWTA